MSNLRNDWKLYEVLALFDKPFNELLFEAHATHIKNHEKWQRFKCDGNNKM
jgi:biotin synthase-like enzyme